MAEFLLYWKSLDTVSEVGEEALEHLGSEQLGRVSPGDTLFLLTGHRGEIFLFNRFRVGEIMSRDETIQRLGTEDVWESELHAMTPPGAGEAIRIIPLPPDLLRELRFISSTRNRLDVKPNGYVNAQQLQTLRRLTSDSADLLAGFWETEEGMSLTEETLLQEVDFGQAEEPEELPDLVSTVDQLRTGIARFNQDLERWPEPALALAKAAIYWVHDSDSGEFGPAKFVGFQDMTLPQYASFYGESGFLGKRTRAAVEDLLGPFEDSQLFQVRLREWAEQRFGPEALRNILATKWRFASLAPASILVYPEADEGDDRPYDPNHADSRTEALRNVRLRRGQQAFRQALLERHGRRCVISGCAVEEVLEAAHILPYRGQEDHHPTNGLLLRADLHTLFDLDLIGIEPASKSIRLHPALVSEYGVYENRRLDTGSDLDLAALRERWRRFQARLASVQV